MLFYQYWKSHCGDKTVVRLSYLHNGISFTGKKTSLYWIKVLVPGAFTSSTAEVILGMGLANERWCHIVTSSLIGWAHTQNDPWTDMTLTLFDTERVSSSNQCHLSAKEQLHECFQLHEYTFTFLSNKCSGWLNGNHQSMSVSNALVPPWVQKIIGLNKEPWGTLARENCWSEISVQAREGLCGISPQFFFNRPPNFISRGPSQAIIMRLSPSYGRISWKRSPFSRRWDWSEPKTAISGLNTCEVDRSQTG